MWLLSGLVVRLLRMVGLGLLVTKAPDSEGSFVLGSGCVFAGFFELLHLGLSGAALPQGPFCTRCRALHWHLLPGQFGTRNGFLLMLLMLAPGSF